MGMAMTVSGGKTSNINDFNKSTSANCCRALLPETQNSECFCCAAKHLYLAELQADPVTVTTNGAASLSPFSSVQG